MNKEHINDAMSRIKKSVARSQSIRNSDLSQVVQSEDVGHNRRETPYDNPAVLGSKSKYYSDAKNIKYPDVRRSYQFQVNDLKPVKANISKILEDKKNINIINKRYEVDTADTETSFGYKFLKKSPSSSSQHADASFGPHNGKFLSVRLNMNRVFRQPAYPRDVQKVE